MLSIGADVRMIQSVPRKNPVVIAKLKIGTPTLDACKIIIYGHYDVQPAVPELWSSPPFTLTGVNGFLYGRGASDNKGPITAMIFGAKELAEENLNAEIVFLLDGEEEAGFDDGGFEQAVCSNLDSFGGADAILISNTYWIGEERPCLVYGMRGAIHLKITMQGPSNNLHSGVHGGAFYEPMTDLIQLLSILIDKSGKVLIPGFFEDVRDVTPDELKLYEQLRKDFDLDQYKRSLGLKELRSDDCTEILMNRWRYPYVCVHGIQTSHPEPHGTVAAISRFCSATLSIRTVPDQDNRKVTQLFERHLRESFEKLNSHNQLSIEVISSGNWWLGDPASKYFNAAESAIKKQWGLDPLYIREGGTMPTSSFLETTLNAPVVHIPFGQITDQAHLENERIRIMNLMKGKDVFKDFVRNAISIKKKL
jgi:di- and tripeptidase